MSHNSHGTVRASPFTRAVVSAMRKLYPEELADKGFDNTGLLLEVPCHAERRQRNSVLLTVDLTKAVADEAIARRDSVVIAYHPIIFRGLKSLTLGDTQQQSLLRLAMEGISVYCPHTAVDAVPGGLGDWLANIVTNSVSDQQSEDSAKERIIPGSNYSSAKDSNQANNSRKNSSSCYRQYSGPSHPVFASDKGRQTSSKHKHTCKPIQPCKEGPPGSGMGRLVTFDQPQLMTQLIDRIANGTGNPKGFSVAIPQGQSVEDISIRSVAICAGSGGSIFKGVDADLFFTGELSHHEALAATEQGRCVVTLFHSNTERGYLDSVMRPGLLEALNDEWIIVQQEESERDDPEKNWGAIIADKTIQVSISAIDRDPYGIVVLQNS